MNFTTYRKWDLVWVDFPDTQSYVIKGKHPAIVVSNNRYCQNTKTLMVIPGTTCADDEIESYAQVIVPGLSEFGLTVATRFDCGRIVTIDTAWISNHTGTMVNTVFQDRFERSIAETLELMGAMDSSRISHALSLIRCHKCGSQFVTRIGLYQTDIHCHICDGNYKVEEMKSIDVTCPDCGMRILGKTNLDPNMKNVHICKCGKEIPVVFDEKKKEFVGQ